MNRKISIWKVTSLVVLVVFILGTTFMVLPYIATNYEMHQVWIGHKESIAYQGDWKQEFSDLEAKETKIKQALNTLYVGMPLQHELSKVIDELFKKANSNNIRVAKILPVEDEYENGYLRKHFELEISGRYHSIARYINALEQGRYLILVESFNLSKAKDQAGLLDGKLVLEITMIEQSP